MEFRSETSNTISPYKNSGLVCEISFGNQQSPNNTIFAYKNSGLVCGIPFGKPTIAKQYDFRLYKFRICLRNPFGNQQSPNNTISPIKSRDLPVEFRSETNHTISPYKIRDLLVNSVRKPAIVKECDVSFIK